MIHANKYIRANFFLFEYKIVLHKTLLRGFFVINIITHFISFLYQVICFICIYFIKMLDMQGKTK